MRSAQLTNAVIKPEKLMVVGPLFKCFPVSGVALTVNNIAHRKIGHFTLLSKARCIVARAYMTDHSGVVCKQLQLKKPVLKTWFHVDRGRGF